MADTQVGKTISISEFGEYRGELFVQNLTTQTILHEDDGDDTLVLGPIGSVGEVQPLPQSIAKKLSFQRLWRRGVVQVVDAEAYSQLFEEQELRREEQVEKDTERLEQAIEPSPATKDLVPGKDKFGEISFNKQGEKNEQGEFDLGVSFTPVGVDSSGKVIETPTKVTLTKTMKSGE